MFSQKRWLLIVFMMALWLYGFFCFAWITFSSNGHFRPSQSMARAFQRTAAWRFMQMWPRQGDMETSPWLFGSNMMVPNMFQHSHIFIHFFHLFANQPTVGLMIFERHLEELIPGSCLCWPQADLSGHL